MRFDVEFFFSCFPKLLLKIPYTMYLGMISILDYLSVLKSSAESPF